MNLHSGIVHTFSPHSRLSLSLSRIHTRTHVKTVGDTCACIHLLKCQRHVARSRWLPRVPRDFRAGKLSWCHLRLYARARARFCTVVAPPTTVALPMISFFLTVCRLAMFAYRFAHHRINALCHMRCYCSTKRMPLTLANFERKSSRTHGQLEMRVIIYLCTC